MKLSWFADDMVIYVKNLKELAKTTQKTTKENKTKQNS